MIEEPFSLPKWGEDRLAGLRRGAGVLVFWRCLAIALAFYFCILPQARAEDLFTVAGVEVDITASSAAEARKKAMAVGEARAFGLLLKRLTLKRDRARLPKLEQGEIATYLRDFQVADEKTSPVRYLAKLTFRFKARDIRSLLRDFALDFAETPSKPVLLLPVFRAVGVVSLWDDPNPWRRAWAGLDKAAGLVPLKMPFGDLTDIATIGAEQAVNGDAQRLEALARLHPLGLGHAEDVASAALSLLSNPWITGAELLADGGLSLNPGP